MTMQEGEGVEDTAGRSKVEKGLRKLIRQSLHPVSPHVPQEIQRETGPGG